MHNQAPHRTAARHAIPLLPPRRSAEESFEHNTSERRDSNVSSVKSAFDHITASERAAAARHDMTAVALQARVDNLEARNEELQQQRRELDELQAELRAAKPSAPSLALPRSAARPTAERSSTPSEDGGTSDAEEALASTNAAHRTKAAMDAFIANDWDERKEGVLQQVEDSLRARTDRELGSDDHLIPTRKYGSVTKHKWTEIMTKIRNTIDDKTLKIRSATADADALRDAGGDYAADPRYKKAADAAKEATDAKARVVQEERELDRDLIAWRDERRTLHGRAQMHIERTNAAARAFEVFKLLHKQKIKSTPPPPTTESRPEHHEYKTKTTELYVPKMLSYALTETEVKRFRLTLDRADHHDRVDELLAYISSKDKTIKLRLDLNDSEIQEMVDEGETTWEIIDAADAYIARAFALCLDDSADRVRRFKIELRNHPQRQQIRSSGQYYGSLMTRFNKAASSTEAREDKDKFKSKVYLAHSMSADVLEANMHELERDWLAFNVEATKFSIHQAILDKLPKTAAGQRLAEDWHDKIAMAELQHVNPTDPADSRYYEFSLQTFRKQLARAIAKQGSTPNTLDANVGTLDGGGDGWHYAAGCDPEAYEASGEFEHEDEGSHLEALAAVRPGGQCWSCGEVASDTDHANGCKAKGPCGVAFCPCNRREPCAVQGMVILTPASKVLNAVNKPLPQSMVSVLVSAQAVYLKSKKGVDSATLDRASAPAKGNRPPAGKGGRGFTFGGKGGRGAGGRGGPYGGRGGRHSAAAATIEDDAGFEFDAALCEAPPVDDDEYILDGKLSAEPPSQQMLSDY